MQVHSRSHNSMAGSRMVLKQNVGKSIPQPPGEMWEDWLSCFPAISRGYVADSLLCCDITLEIHSCFLGSCLLLNQTISLSRAVLQTQAGSRTPRSYQAVVP